MLRYNGRRSKRVIKSEINIVPLLDVLLVLLLIFMAVAPMINQSVEVDLPQTTDAKVITPQEEKPPIILEVSGIGQFALLVEQDRKTNLTPEQVVEETKKILKEQPKAIFLIGGAKDVPYEEVIKAINMLKEGGVASVGLMTQPVQ